MAGWGVQTLDPGSDGLGRTAGVLLQGREVVAGDVDHVMGHRPERPPVPAALGLDGGAAQRLLGPQHQDGSLDRLGLPADEEPVVGAHRGQPAVVHVQVEPVDPFEHSADHRAQPPVHALLRRGVDRVAVDQREAGREESLVLQGHGHRVRDAASHRAADDHERPLADALAQSLHVHPDQRFQRVGERLVLVGGEPGGGHHVHVPFVPEELTEPGVLVGSGDRAQRREAHERDASGAGGQRGRPERVLVPIRRAEPGAHGRDRQQQFRGLDVPAGLVHPPVDGRQPAGGLLGTRLRGARLPSTADLDLAQLPSDEAGDRLWCGVVEGEGGGEPERGGGVEAVAEFDGGEGVQAEFDDRPVGGDGGGVGVREHRARLGTDQVEQDRLALVLAEPGQPGEQGGCAAGGRRLRGGAAARADQTPQHGGYGLGGVPPWGEVDGGREEDGHVALPVHRGVEEGECFGGGEGAEATSGDAGSVGVGEVCGDAAGVFPESPGEGECGESLGGAVCGEGVQEGVGGGVAGLACSAEGGGDGGEEDEGGEVVVAGEVVQVPGAVDLGGEDGAEPVGGEGSDDAVVRGAGGVDDGGEGVFGGDLGQEGG